jgi:hypothetical protein
MTEHIVLLSCGHEYIGEHAYPMGVTDLCPVCGAFSGVVGTREVKRA